MNAIGKLDQRVTIQQPDAGQDAIGQPLTGWVNRAEVWADVRHGSGLEQIKADALTSVVKASIRIRARSDVTSAMRVLCGATTYQIKTVTPSDDRRWTFLACEVIE
jgi:SPP1 family predicted phage head-tail adaptor